MGLNLTQEMPDIAFAYWSHVDLMSQYPGMYGLDSQRAKYHVLLCKAYGLTKEQTKIVTDNLNRYETAVDMHIDLMLIKRGNYEPRYSKTCKGCL